MFDFTLLTSIDNDTNCVLLTFITKEERGLDVYQWEVKERGCLFWELLLKLVFDGHYGVSSIARLVPTISFSPTTV